MWTERQGAFLSVITLHIFRGAEEWEPGSDSVLNFRRNAIDSEITKTQIFTLALVHFSYLIKDKLS